MSKPAPSPAEQCAACGHGAHGNHVCPGCLMGCGSSLPPPAPSPATPCSVYPCPCACHRLGPHVPTGECYEAASDVLTEGRFRSLADCATGYLVRDDTTLDQMAQTETYFKKLLAHDAALRAELNLRTLELDRWKKIYKVAQKQRDAAETRVEKLVAAITDARGWVTMMAGWYRRKQEDRDACIYALFSMDDRLRAAAALEEKP